MRFSLEANLPLAKLLPYHIASFLVACRIQLAAGCDLLHAVFLIAALPCRPALLWVAERQPAAGQDVQHTVCFICCLIISLSCFVACRTPTCQQPRCTACSLLSLLPYHIALLICGLQDANLPLAKMCSMPFVVSADLPCCLALLWLAGRQPAAGRDVLHAVCGTC
jgi:hypothetical protein